MFLTIFIIYGPFVGARARVFRTCYRTSLSLCLKAELRRRCSLNGFKTCLHKVPWHALALKICLDLL